MSWKLNPRRVCAVITLSGAMSICEAALSVTCAYCWVEEGSKSLKDSICSIFGESEKCGLTKYETLNHQRLLCLNGDIC